MIRKWLQGWLRAIHKWLTPPPDLRQENAALVGIIHALRQMNPADRGNFDNFRDAARELLEARMMAGSGPNAGMPSQTLFAESQRAMQRIEGRALGLKETAVSAQGAFGDIELALQNVEWRREINLGWLEFSRWGIQQIILISRLYYIKNPLLRRAIDVVATYVFGRGVEVSSTDPDANEVLTDFFLRNEKVFGQNALVEQMKRKCYDGNLFWAFFADKQDTGEVNVRLMDATEINDILSDPDDSESPWYFQRVWAEKTLDLQAGKQVNRTRTAWYPALGYDPLVKPDNIDGNPVIWNVPIKHRKVGGVANWKFGCPIAYPALDWAKASRKFLEACATVKQALAQIAMTFTTKGGPAAIEGAKQQLQTTVNAQGQSLWDQNPTPVNASIFASGPGTSLEAFKTTGAGGNPSEVKEFRNMVGICFGIPPTWLGDLETANLSTATTLDRPTELGFICKQEEWVEDLTCIAKYVLEVAKAAPSGKLSESKKRIVTLERKFNVRECHFYYEAPSSKADDDIEIRVNFPAIREGDLPQVVTAITTGMTLANKAGQVIGIDEKVGVRLLLEAFGVENSEEIVEEMYPSTASGVKGKPGYKPKYDPCRTTVPVAPPIQKPLPNPGGVPQNPDGSQPAQLEAPAPAASPTPAKEAARRLIEAIVSL